MSVNPSTVMLEGVLDRLEETLTLETDALRNRHLLDFEEISRRKSRSLLELSRAVRTLPGTLEGALLARLARLRATLTANRDLLELHLAAAQEVAAILGEALRAAESDGTYSAALGTRRAAP
ncbi:hypothetical protein MWN33_07780 [Starkeya koreensis]|uniref:Flagellar protein FlgN n=1 Tax=Ancylobacter koreensis TaxID=266121 RepID=A0ABT0DLF6_9HYPH|nr:hypothetical protein [Ancylobacter koreensis]MCK0207932.1 hypothetical protein [Ancylobacter koreensis]